MTKVRSFPPDRYVCKDTRVNHKQRPTVFMDSEKNLHRKVIANQKKSIPMTGDATSVLGLKIIHTFIGLGIYDEKGKRKSKTIEIS